MPAPYGPTLIDRIDRAFLKLGTAPRQLAIDGRDVHPGLPQRRIDIVELRSILLHPSTSFETRDAAMRFAITRAQGGSDEWMTAALGLLAHGLRRVAGRLSWQVDGRVEDLDAEIVEGAVRAIRRCSPECDRLASRILWAAFRQGRKMCKPSIEDSTPPDAMPDFAEEDDEDGEPVEPRPPLDLEAAVAAEVISVDDAELIRATRVGGGKVAAIARQIGCSEDTLRHRRRRAQKRLLRWYTDGAK